jgi:hypothetical protein
MMELMLRVFAVWTAWWMGGEFSSFRQHAPSQAENPPLIRLLCFFPFKSSSFLVLIAVVVSCI